MEETEGKEKREEREEGARKWKKKSIGCGVACRYDNEPSFLPSTPPYVLRFLAPFPPQSLLSLFSLPLPLSLSLSPTHCLLSSFTPSLHYSHRALFPGSCRLTNQTVFLLRSQSLIKNDNRPLFFCTSIGRIYSLSRYPQRKVELTLFVSQLSLTRVPSSLSFNW